MAWTVKESPPFQRPNALALSDDYQKGLVQDLSVFEALCGRIASEIAGRDVSPRTDPCPAEGLTRVTALAFNALLSGLLAATSA